MLGPFNKLSRVLPLLALASMSVACADASEPTDSSQQQEPPGADPEDGTSAGAAREIAEADIVQVADGRLYAMSKSGSVAVVDISQPGRLALLGKTRLPGQPFEMYRQGNLLVTMSKAAFESNGSLSPLVEESRYPYYRPAMSSAVIVLDMEDPTNIRTVATHVVPGMIDDSRVVGDILYLVSTEQSSCWRCGPGTSTHVTSFKMNDAIGLPKVDDLEYSPPSGYSGWKRSVATGQNRLYIGGASTGGGLGGEIDVIDISDPQGHLVRGAHLAVPGPIYTRWQIDERGDVLRVVSQPGAYGSNNAYKMPAIDTFKIEGTATIVDGVSAEGAGGASFTSIGHLEMSIPAREGLRGVRFDADRAYVITYRRTDPLYVIDLANPAAPQQRGELHIPGFVFHLEPHGNRVLGLGVDVDDPNGNLNVSLFDVSNLDAPQMLQRVAFGDSALQGNDATANTQLAEDHDRIQKSFKVLDDGLIVVPFSGTTGIRGTGDTCASIRSGVQLIDWQNDRLQKRALLPLRGNPRRALLNQGELVTVSDSNVRSFSLANKDQATPTADVVIGQCVSRYGYDEPGGFMCTVHAPGGSSRNWAAFGALAGLLAFVVVRRRRA